MESFKPYISVVQYMFEYIEFNVDRTRKRPEINIFYISTDFNIRFLNRYPNYTIFWFELHIHKGINDIYCVYGFSKYKTKSYFAYIFSND